MIRHRNRGDTSMPDQLAAMTAHEINSIVIGVVIVVGLIAWAIVRVAEARHGIVRDEPWFSVKLRADEKETEPCSRCPHARHTGLKCSSCPCTSPFRYSRTAAS